MRHARAEALDQLEPLLHALRAFDALKEKSRGLFYRRGRSFLHFHEDSAGLFADLSTGGDDQRFRVSTQRERAAFLKVVRAALAA
jgi:hypothetical protein